MNVEHSWLAKVCKFQASKHEGYLDEEKEMINRGLKNAKKLVGWYNERLRSLQKRANLLARGLVAVDSAVHEQKLNYLRAHIAELNRRITSLLESSERGFPSYSNLQVRTQMPQPSDDRTQYYQRQNIKLCQELADKNKLIERLMREQEDTADKYYVTRNADPKRITMIRARPTQLYKSVPDKIHGTLM